MRFADRAASIVFCVALTVTLSAHNPAPIHHQRYAMGTMFDIVAYHDARGEAERAIARALDEVVRLDDVLSHFKETSDLSRLMRDGYQQFVAVDPSLYEVLEAAIGFSRRSAGTFDVTIGPLLNAWTRAHDQGRSPSAEEIARARQCVGFERIELADRSRIRLLSACMAITLGGIGKGYAVDRAMEILRNAGLRNVLVNAGSSSISAVGSPPGTSGWPVHFGKSGGERLMLRNAALSTSQHVLRPHLDGPGASAGILDPLRGEPVQHPLAVTVVAPRGTDADALSTTLILMTIDQGRRLLAQFPDASAVWMDPAGAVTASHGDAFSGSRLH